MVRRLALALRKKYVARRIGLRGRWLSRALFDRRQFASWMTRWVRCGRRVGILQRVLKYVIADGKIMQVEIIAGAARGTTGNWRPRFLTRKSPCNAHCHETQP